MFGSANDDCFVCRMFRTFAFTGLGALCGGYGALLLGFSRPNAMIGAFLGGMAGLAVMHHLQRSGKLG